MICNQCRALVARKLINEQLSATSIGEHDLPGLCPNVLRHGKYAVQHIQWLKM
jgi:hypothetical protein